MRFPGALVCLVLFFSVGTPPGSAEDLVWAKAAGGPFYDAVLAVATGPGGATCLAGHFVGTADVDPSFRVNTLTSAGGDDGFVLMLGADGRFRWAGSLGGPSTDLALDAAVDSGGGVLVVGDFRERADFDPGSDTCFLDSAGGTDAFIARLDPGGNFLWAHRIGSTGDDRATHAAVDAAGHWRIAGYFAGTVDFDPGPGTFLLTSAGAGDIFLLTLDAGGAFLWAGRLGGSAADTPQGMAWAGGALYTTGSFSGTADFDPGPAVFNLTAAGQNDVFVSKLENDGQFAWAARLGGSLAESAGGIGVGADGAVFVAGSFQGTADFDPGPKTAELVSFGQEDVFVARLGPAGSYVWARQLGGSEREVAYGLVLGEGDFLSVMGDFNSGPADFDPGPDLFPLTPAGAFDIYLVKLDLSGNFAWAGRFGGSQVDAGRGLASGPGGTLTLGGAFYGTADFDPGPEEAMLSPAGLGDGFVVRVAPCWQRGAPLYGRQVFPPRCSADAGGLPGGPGQPHRFAAAQLGILRRPADRFFLSAGGKEFRELAVDDLLRVGGADSGLGPYARRPGVPPYHQGAPIEQNLVPDPPQEVSSLVPLGSSQVLFEAWDTDRQIFGNTPVFLLADCGLAVSGTNPVGLRFVSYEAWSLAFAPEFDIRYGSLDQLRGEGNFSHAACLGRFFNNPGVDSLPAPPPGSGRYYLARGLNTCQAMGYGQSAGLDPDPREELDSLPRCP